VRACATCGTPNPEEARFCQACGAPSAPAPRDWEQRKTVTVLFADVTGSTALGEALDPESLRRVMSRFFMEMSSILQRHGGSVEKFIGDAVMAVFGIPAVHEDDALRAVRAAAEMRQVLRSLNEELEGAHGVTLQIRTGVNTGTVVVGDLVAGQSFVAGDAVNVAARLEQSAPPGEILIGEDTFRLVRHAVTAEPVEPMKVRNREGPVTSYLLREVHQAAPRGESPLRSPMVGRVADVGVLLDLVEGATRHGEAHLATVLGPAGVGKSRLVEELIAGLGDQMRSLSGRCLTYGEGITYWPVSEVVRQALGIRGESSPAEIRRRLSERVRGREHGDRIVEGVAQMMGLSDAAGSQEQMFWGTRRFLEVVADERPLLVVIDDAHWGEPTFLDFVEYLADFASAPLLLICMARLDLLEDRPGWGTGRRNATTLTLEPLTEGESIALIRNLLGVGNLEPATGRHLIRATEGNPLFIEEMLRMLIDEGLVRRGEAGWSIVGDVSSLPAPPTIQALLSARLERLQPEELAAIERASVVGKVFSWGAVAALTPEPDRPRVGRHLQALVRKELVLPDTDVMDGEDTFRFRHLMIRDAAYEAIPKEVRADLHELFASWLEGREGEEFDEILGHHLERAYRWRTEIAPPDDRARALAERAVQQLASAGRRAFARGDVPATVRLLPRAVGLLPQDHPTRPGLLADYGQALMEHGELERADEVLTEAARTAAAVGDRSAEASARLTRLLVRLSTHPEDTTDGVRAEVDEVAPVFEELGDERGLAKVARLRAEIEWLASRFGAAAGHLERTIEHARRAGDRRLEMDALAQLAVAILFGPTPADEGIRRCGEIHARSGGDRRVEAAVLSVEAELRAMQGRFEGTREQIARAREILEDLGLRFRSRASEALASVEMLAGDPEAAWRAYMSGYETLEEIGERGFLSTTAAELAQVAWAQGHHDEADRFATISEETGAPDDVATVVTAKGVRAKLLARKESFADAERFAREAVDAARETDDLNLRADALLDLADVLRAAGRGPEALEALEEAAALYEEKGNLVGAQRARALLHPA